MTYEIKRLLRAFTLVMLFLLSIFGVWAGITEAENNTRKIAFGEAYEIIEFGAAGRDEGTGMRD